MDDKFYGINIPLDRLIKLRLHARAIDLSGQRKVATDLAGGQMSYFRGRGMDFEEVRHYQPGDDIRVMDWRVTARTGKPHTKVYREERERPVFVVVDQSPTMHFGTRVTFKADIAAQAAALIAWASVANHDRVGGLIFSDNSHIEIRPKAGTHGVLPLLKALTTHENTTSANETGEAFAHALLRLRRVVRPGSAIYIFSDFNTLNKEAENHLSQLAQHNDIIAGFIYDSLEKEPPPPNRYTVSDGINTTTFDSSLIEFCNNFRTHFQEKYQTLKQVLYKRNIPMIELATDESVTEKLRKQLSYRRQGKKSEQ